MKSMNIKELYFHINKSCIFKHPFAVTIKLTIVHKSVHSNEGFS